MNKFVLIDTGAWVALLNRKDTFHQKSLEIFSLLNEYGRPITTVPVITEASHLINKFCGYRVLKSFINSINQGASELAEFGRADLLRIEELMLKYSDLQIDLADASLIALAERLNEKQIISTDKEFNFYKWSDKNSFENLLLI